MKIETHVQVPSLHSVLEKYFLSKLSINFRPVQRRHSSNANGGQIQWSISWPGIG